MSQSLKTRRDCGVNNDEKTWLSFIIFRLDSLCSIAPLKAATIYKRNYCRKTLFSTDPHCQNVSLTTCMACNLTADIRNHNQAVEFVNILFPYYRWPYELHSLYHSLYFKNHFVNLFLFRNVRIICKSVLINQQTVNQLPLTSFDMIINRTVCSIQLIVIYVSSQCKNGLACMRFLSLYLWK